MTLDAPHIWPRGQAPDPAFCDEAERLAVIASFGLDEFPADEELTRITRFAAHLCGTEMATISLVDDARQRFLASEGIDYDETPRSTSFCAHTMLSGSMMEVLDATQDERFSDFASVTGERHLRYYAGMPLISEEGAPLGALCVFDSDARSQPLGVLQREGLEVLAASVMRLLQARRAQIQADSALEGSEERFRMLADNIPDIVWSTDSDGKFDYFNRRWYEFIGVFERPEEGWTQYFHPEDHESWYSEWERARKVGVPYESEYRLRGQDGEYRWMLTRGLPLKDATGNITRWFGTITDIDENYRESEARDLLAQELAHRIKNVFSIITGLLRLRARGNPERSAYALEMDEVIRALAKAQEFVLPTRPHDDQQLVDFIRILMEPYTRTVPDAVEVAGPSFFIGPRSATPLALVLQELATNATKYGALSVPEGKVALQITENDEEMMLLWRESGGPKCHEPGDTGFGSRLLSTTIERQLSGKITREWRSEGLACTITIPKSQLQE